ncbi:GGDEF domain-containing protein [Wukongibacter sp. M2B1]|uniref:GGDEF domain-containing protein n=1 Tax=Wukongibacter sp. M2B1 TaxID=3088895 RepID=UPI003D793C69
MIQLDILNQAKFLIIICFSFLIFTFTISMNKKNSLSKALGLAFILPFIICAYSSLFLDSTYTPYILWISETILSMAFLILILLKFNNKSYDAAIITIFIIGVCSYFILMEMHIIPLYLLSHRNQVFISAYIIIVNIGLMKYRKFPEKTFFLANIFLLASTLFSFFQNHNNGLIIAPGFSFMAYLTFYKYVYYETYNEHMSKIREINRLKKKIDRSVNKEVKKQLLHYEMAKEKLLIKSKTDSLTKAYNKETIINIIDEMIEFKKNEKFCVMMFDIDNFKYINDTFGHIIGDVCIKNLVSTTRNSIREKDLLGRFGGDEFVIVLPGIDVEEGKAVAERLRENVSLIREPEFTISIGISCYPQDGDTAKDLVSLADEGLYASKEKGKNMVSYAKVL